MFQTKVSGFISDDQYRKMFQVKLLGLCNSDLAIKNQSHLINAIFLRMNWESFIYPTFSVTQEQWRERNRITFPLECLFVVGWTWVLLCLTIQWIHRCNLLGNQRVVFFRYSCVVIALIVNNFSRALSHGFLGKTQQLLSETFFYIDLWVWTLKHLWTLKHFWNISSESALHILKVLVNQHLE